MSALAILGGKPAIDKPFRKYNHIDEAEIQAVNKVLQSGVLSDFVGARGKNFHGGRQVQAFEQAWRERFGVKHAVTMNSATSCLAAAVGAVGAGPGDEVIVSPYTMSASAAAILVFNALPVFADIDPDTFNMDPHSIEERITKNTKALMVSNIFGHPADYNRIREIAGKRGIKIIEDNAQSPLAEYDGRLAGTIGDIGVFSLNYHKHIHTGEGGVCVTNDDGLAERLCMIRNHAEAAIEQKEAASLTNMIGFNFRLGEIEAAIGIEQLKKIDRLVASRIAIADGLTRRLSDIEGLQTPVVRPGCRHVYYVYAMKYRPHRAVPRNLVVKALQAEGVPLGAGYVKPLYLQPIYQKRIGYGEKGCPFTCAFHDGKLNYEKGLCPAAERMHEEDLFLFEPCKHELSEGDLDAISEAFHKVFGGLDILSQLNGQ
ncbi:MAG: DegT/DnrJ/EryC1/StrS family aminotransferase [Nitrospinae bacterium]|nr:DegT/DnrJ/EryC1/StrS family aminotransferase [Nitrospinota bacterium]